MAYQKGFFGISKVGPDTGARQLVEALGTMSKGLETLAVAEGEKQDREVQAKAEQAARSDNLKSYQDGVDKGLIDATKSEFYIATYDNIKGQAAGIEYNQKKNLAYAEFFAEQTNQDIDDVDGSLYMAWSQDYDKTYLDSNKNQSNFFLKGFDPFISQTNQNLGSSYAKHNGQRLKEKGKLNLSLVLEAGLKETIGNPDAQKEVLNSIEAKVELLRFVPKNEMNQTIVNAYQNVIAEIADKNSLNADYASALDLAYAVKDYTRANGSKLLSGKEEKDFDTYIDNLQTERVTYETNRIKRTQSEAVASYVEQQVKAAKGKFINSVYNTDIMTDGSAIWAELEPEFNQKYHKFLMAHPNVSDDIKKDVAQQMLMDMSRKYEDVEVDGGGAGLFLDGWRSDSTFNVRGRTPMLAEANLKLAYEKRTVSGRDPANQRKPIALPADTEISAAYIYEKTGSEHIWSLMRNAGYVDRQGRSTVRVNENGEPAKATLVDLARFYKEYKAWDEGQ
ncbi:hypothetical protein [uncultured phage_MedDCM-OCT-S28-C10]|uniref:Uncharacterized protein n=1 Tax=uncultured phage_MedDCM-OCT-S28-C10 TaxID=2741077 RepID=A0A6S4P8D5_9CAUD|nr:hypothetical protein HOQ60_gp06 [uncultured phage_MedDCM-OCT-S28-C10]BAQ94049.1 hypothetical protein [uncultured phage_MedDCM-OCT-S28-C10]